MSPGALINVQAGLLRNEFGNGNWTNNQGSMFVASGGTLEMWDSGGGITVDALNGSGVVQHTSFGGTENFTVGVAGGSGTFSGLITDTSGHPLTLVKKGGGTQVLSGSNTFTGGTSLVGGVLSFANGALVGNISLAGNVTLQWYGNNSQDISSQLQAIPGINVLRLDTNGNSVTLGSGPSVSVMTKVVRERSRSIRRCTPEQRPLMPASCALAGNAALAGQSVAVKNGAMLALTANSTLSNSSLILSVSPEASSTPLPPAPD